MQSQSLFTNYIIAGVEASLARVRAVEYVLPEADRQQAWHLLSFALKVEEAWPVTRELLLTLAPKMEMAGHWEGWIAYLEKGVERARFYADSQTEAETLLELSAILQRTDRLPESQDRLLDVIQLHMLKKHHHVMALSRLSMIRRIEHNYVQSNSLIKQAMQLADVGSAEFAYACFAMGQLMYDQHQWHRAVQYITRAANTWTLHGDKRRIALCQLNLGRIQLSKADYESSISYFDKAIRALGEIHDISNLAIAQMNMGIAYSLLDLPEKALSLHEKSEVIFRQLGARRNLAFAKNNIGIEYNNLRQWHAAKAKFLESIEIWHSLEDTIECANSMDGLAKALSGLKLYEQAKATLNKAIAILELSSESPRKHSILRDIREQLFQ